MTEQELCRQQYIPVNLLCTKVIFHGDSQDHSVTENQEETEQNMPPVADHVRMIFGLLSDNFGGDFVSFWVKFTVTVNFLLVLNA